MSNQIEHDAFWEGFDSAIDLIKNFLDGYEYIDLDKWASMSDGIDNEVELYKKDA